MFPNKNHSSPPALWDPCDYVLQNNYVIAHVAGAMNTATDFLSRTEINTTEKLEMKLRNTIQTKAVEVNIQSSGIADEEQIYLHPDDEKKLGPKRKYQKPSADRNTTNRKTK